MMTDKQKHTIIEAIKELSNPTELEKDILDTIEELSKQSLDMAHAQARITMLDSKYQDLYEKVTALPSTVQKPSWQINETDLWYILRMQLNFLLEKEWEENNRGQNENGNP